MKYFIGLSCYDGISAECLMALGMDGVILGDPFCQKRMFHYGAFDLCEKAREYHSAGLEILYQTGMYLTDRRFEEELERAAFLYEKCNARRFLVQDVGFADRFAKDFQDADLIWSQFGRNRGGLANSYFPAFLSHIGVYSIACTTAQRVDAVWQSNLNAYAVYGRLHYHTLSRECYNRYLNNSFDGHCNRECLSGRMELQHNKWTSTVNGFVLGQSIHYDVSDAFIAAMRNAGNVLIYSDTIEAATDAVTGISRFREEKK